MPRRSAVATWTAIIIAGLRRCGLAKSVLKKPLPSGLPVAEFARIPSCLERNSGEFRYHSGLFQQALRGSCSPEDPVRIISQNAFPKAGGSQTGKRETEARWMVLLVRLRGIVPSSTPTSSHEHENG